VCLMSSIRGVYFGGMLRVVASFLDSMLDARKLKCSNSARASV
jgi:hypothetical protein